jgi:hypothetical protein
MSSSLFSLLPSPERITRYAHLISSPLGALLAFAGVKKLLTKWEAGWAVYRNNGFSPAEYRNTAIIEVIGALELAYPRTRFGGVITLISMIAWIEVETMRRKKGGALKPKSPFYLNIPARVTEALLVVMAWALWPSDKV